MATFDFYTPLAAIGTGLVKDWNQGVTTENLLRAYDASAPGTVRAGPLIDAPGLGGMGRGPATTGSIDTYGNAISGIESGGRYDALGPVIKSGPYAGDQAVGKYQVMGKNVPEWSRAALGREMTPQEFAASPEAQDAVFRHKFGEYVQRYGNPQDAASAWFTGRPLAEARAAGAKDQLGTTVDGYVSRFASATGGPDVPAAGAPTAQGFVVPGQAAQSSRGFPREIIRALLADPETRTAGLSLWKDSLKGEEVKTVDLGDAVGVLDKAGNVVSRIPKAKIKEDDVGDKIRKEIDARRSMAGGIGLKEGTDAYQRYVAEGKLPAEKSPTEGQSNAALYARRMEEANTILENPKIAAAGQQPRDRIAGSVPLAGNYLVSPEYQQSEQARRDFINAVLRRESGAAISPSEFDNANRQYFPQPGDKPDVLDQKRRNRLTAIEGIRAAAGPAYTRAIPAQQEPARQSAAGGKPQAAVSPAIPEGATATNRATGERIVFRGGKWVPQ